jgi:hypothetical protein
MVSAVRSGEIIEALPVRQFGFEIDIIFVTEDVPVRLCVRLRRSASLLRRSIVTPLGLRLPTLEVSRQFVHSYKRY